MSRNYFPALWGHDAIGHGQPTVVLADVQLLTRPPEHAPTLAEAIAAICSGHGEAT